MNEKKIHKQLADHFSKLPNGLPVSEELIEILEANLTPLEAEVAMALPNNMVPLKFIEIDKITRVADLSEEQTIGVLEGLAQKGIIFTGKTQSGERGYALWQGGYGFPQVFHWKGEDTPHARKMAELVIKYGQNPEVFKQRSVSTGTKVNRYIPVSRSIEITKQGVYSQHMMEDVIQNSRSFAVAHCSCRVRHSMVGKECDHPTEVCLKFNEIADFLIDKGFAREITKEDALDIIQKSEEAGLVHFVENAGSDIQINCNCCGCACWNVGPIKRREVPRDAIMATYFLRETNEDECIGCGECVDVCPVDAVNMVDDTPVVDLEWCIGCGVCSRRCAVDAIKMELRPDKSSQLPAETFWELHEIIMEEKGLK